MFKFILISLFLLSISSCTSSKKICIYEIPLIISDVEPKVYIKTAGRKRAIFLNISKYCGTDNYLVPTTQDRALEMLKNALPSDYLNHIRKDGKSFAYKDGNYGYSVDTDVANYISKIWNLDSNKSYSFCNDTELNKGFLKFEDCYFKLLFTIAKLNQFNSKI